MRIVALFLLACLGCTEQASITDGECGNFVLEDGEECDRPDDTCTADCRVQCSPASQVVCDEVDGVLALDRTCCPQGFACGADGACRAPNGHFTSAGPGQPFISVPFGGEFRVGDLDGDHVDDALGVTSGNVIARYGSTATPLVTAQQRSTSFSNGAIAIGDVTGDRRLDVLIPTSGGLSIMDSSSGVPEAVAIPASFIPEVVGLRVAGATDDEIVQLVAFDGGVALAFQLLFAPEASPEPRLPCASVLGLQNALFKPFNIAGTRLHPFLDGVRVAVPLVIVRPTEVPLLCIEFFRTDGGADVPPLAIDLDDAAFDYTPAMAGEVLFANLDATSGCPELVIPVIRSDSPGEEVNLVLPGVGTAGNCTVAQSFNAKPPIPGGAALGAIKLVAPPAVVLITPSGLRRDASADPIIPATRPWTQVAIGDVDGNGLQDFATIGPGDDVEVFEQQDAVVPEWRVSRIPTTNLLTDVVAGDFDGDQRDDIAFATTDLAKTQIRVAFRDSSLFAPSHLVDTVVDHHQLSVGALFDAARGDPAFDQFDDLMTSHGGTLDGDMVDGDDIAKLTLQFGGANRELTAPWLPLDNGFGRLRFAVASAVGPYGEAGASGVIAGFFTAADSDDGDCDPDGVRVLVRATRSSAGIANGLDRIGADVKYCQTPNATSTASGLLALEFSGFVPLTDDPDPPVLMVSRLGEIPDGQCGALLRLGAAPVALQCDELFDPGGESFARIVDVMKVVLRVERIGDHDFLVSGFAPDSLDPNEQRIYVFRMTAEIDASGLRMTNVIDLSAELEAVHPDLVCQDATAIELGTRTTNEGVFGAGRELAFACEQRADALIRIVGRFEGDVGAIDEDLGFLPIALYADLETGDVNGDGVPDLIAASLAGTIHALLGCDSRGACP